MDLHFLLDTTQGVIAKEMVKVQSKWQTYKQEIVEAIGKEDGTTFIGVGRSGEGHSSRSWGYTWMGPQTHSRLAVL